jgi:hypothetical protein
LPGDLLAFDRDVLDKIVPKVFQVEEAAARYKEGKVSYPRGSEAARWDKTIWPVVVLREPLPVFFLITRRVRELIEKAKPKHAFPRSDIPTSVISSEDLELALHAKDPDRLRRLLAEWRMDDAYKEESFRNFYLHRHHDDAPVNAPFLATQYEASFTRAALELGFPPPGPPKPRREGTNRAS